GASRPLFGSTRGRRLKSYETMCLYDDVKIDDFFSEHEAIIRPEVTRLLRLLRDLLDQLSSKQKNDPDPDPFIEPSWPHVVGLAKRILDEAKQRGWYRTKT
ncbi:MAG TPA: hypothetical protein PLU35_09845, partial [Phycisphaerales bacterium]|nr:hypothetical protein [Phycisphaerales bacterium]